MHIIVGAILSGNMGGSRGGQTASDEEVLDEIQRIEVESKGSHS